MDVYRTPRPHRSHAPKAKPPEWDTSRPYLTGAALFDPIDESAAPLASFPSATQHTLAVEDALHALLGMRTSYTKVTDEDEPTYHPSTDALLHAHPEVAPLLSRILPLASHHATVAAFIESTRVAAGSGFVRQAVGVALSELLADYRALVVRLEDSLRAGQLSLQKLLYLVQPSARSMALLRSVVVACTAKRGGAALNALYKLAVSHVGANDVSDVLAFVVGRAAAPVFSIMDVWIRTGVVDDPHGEFFIQESAGYSSSLTRATVATSSSAWEMRYVVNRENLPDLLAPFVENVLRSGKYLNVLRECGLDTARVVSTMPPRRGEAARAGGEKDGVRLEHLQLSGRVLLGPEASRRIAKVVENSFAVSSRALMEYLDEEIKIMERLRSLKRFFLMERSDFMITFFDSAAAELSKRRKDVSRSKLASLLDLSIRTSVSSLDQFQDDILCVLCTEDFASEISGMTSRGEHSERRKSDLISGYEAFGLDYKLQWPMSLIVSKMEILKYQLIFRYIFYCKYVERELEECWRHQAQSKRPLRRAAGTFVRSFALRNRMLQFLRNMMYFTTADVLEPNWRTLESGVRKSETIDALMQQHTRFLDVSIEQMLLSNDKHLTVFKSICETCVSFAAYTEKFASLFLSPLPRSRIEDALQERNYPATLAKFETAFDMYLEKLMDGVSAVSKKRANVHLSNLCERLDVDGFYSRAGERSLQAYKL